MAVADIIIVLGGGISREGVLPLWVPPRLDKALELYQKGIAPRVLLSGKGRDDFPVAEAVAMRKYLTRRDLDPLHVLEESLSRDTLQNAYFSRVIHLDPLGIKSVMVITNEFHIRRTELIFNFVLGGQIKSAYQGVTDQGISQHDLELRAYTEAELYRFYQRLFASLTPGDLKGLHSFIYDIENPYYREYQQLGKRLKDKMTLY